MRRISLLCVFLFVAPALQADEAKPLRLGTLEVGQTGTLLTGGTVTFKVIEVQGEKTVLVHQYARSIGRVGNPLLVKGVPTSNMMVGRAASLLGVFKVTNRIPGRKRIVGGGYLPDTFILEKIAEAP